MHLEPQSEYGVGFDPAWKTLGTAAVKVTETPFKFDVLLAKTSSPGDDKLGPAWHIFEVFGDVHMAINDYGCVPVTMERYVSYGPVRSSHTEKITRIIGMIEMKAHIDNLFMTPLLVKAIDWKTKLCQTLVKYAGFDNPSASLDKKFSLAAAKHISTNPEKITNDHEADAICLAAYPHVLAQAYASRTSGRTSLD